MSFDAFDLDDRIMAGIRSAGFETPTPIQSQAIPIALEGRDVLGLAPTGTGKTAAFMLPILNRLTEGSLRKVRALIVAPTRELADQIHQTGRLLAKQTRVRTTAIYGGVGKKQQLDALQRGVEIVVACPGRLLDLMGEGQIDLSSVEVLVLDEADRMCDMGFLPDIRRILKAVPHRKQTLFFSATMPTEIRDLSDSMLNDPEMVQIGRIAPVHTVSHALYPVEDNRMKRKMLFQLLENMSHGRMLIFTRTKYRARNLARDLEKLKYRVTALQGNMSQNARTRSIVGFKTGKFDILVATDIAARGIDVTEISHVINVDMPDTVDAYTHRIGRTGRAENSGEAYTFVMGEDEDIVRKIERILGKPIERRAVDGFDYGSFDPMKAPARYAAQPRPNNGGGRRRPSGGGRHGSKRRNRPRSYAQR